MDKIRGERRKAKANRNKYTGSGNDSFSFSSGGGRYGGFGSESLGGGSSSYSGSGGGYGDRGTSPTMTLVSVLITLQITKTTPVEAEASVAASETRLEGGTSRSTMLVTMTRRRSADRTRPPGDPQLLRPRGVQPQQRLCPLLRWQPGRRRLLSRSPTYSTSTTSRRPLLPQRKTLTRHFRL